MTIPMTYGRMGRLGSMGQLGSMGWLGRMSRMGRMVQLGRMGQLHRETNVCTTNQKVHSLMNSNMGHL